MNRFYTLFVVSIFSFSFSFAQIDTVRVMSYNTLYYGNGCSGSDGAINRYLETIVSYTNPDILGLVKMTAIKLTSSDKNGTKPVGFADSVVNHALNIAYPNRYAHGALTNEAGANDMQVIFYDKNKFSLVSTKTIYSYITDFNLYKFYYKLSTPATDSTFLYVVLVHTQSGNAPESDRDKQLTSIFSALKSMFSQLPNLMIIGDFNLHDTNLEAGYEALVGGSNANYVLNDPPVIPDKKYTYPMYSDSKPQNYPSNLTTTTQVVSNSCGSNTTGGAKSWYDHFVMSNSIVKNSTQISYVPNSFIAVGNDGNRVGIAINDSTTNGKNESAPSSVINALWRLSDKYPIMAKLAINPTPVVTSILDEFSANSSYNINIYVNDANAIQINATDPSLNGKNVTVQLYDMQGRPILSQNITLGSFVQIPKPSVATGIYCISLSDGSNVYKSQRLYLQP